MFTAIYVVFWMRAASVLVDIRFLGLKVLDYKNEQASIGDAS